MHPQLVSRFDFLRALAVGAALLSIGASGCGGGAGDTGEYGRSIESAWFSPYDANSQFPSGGKWSGSGNPAGKVEGGVAFVDGANVDVETVKMAVLDDDGTIVAGPVAMTYSEEAFRGFLNIPSNPSPSQRTLTIGMSAKDPNGRELFDDGEIGTFVQEGNPGS